MPIGEQHWNNAATETQKTFKIQ